jgi:hypothetical protein
MYRNAKRFVGTETGEKSVGWCSGNGAEKYKLVQNRKSTKSEKQNVIKFN